MIEQYLNKKNSLRQLTDKKFSEIVDQLAEELIYIDYHYAYSFPELHMDWKNLCRYDATSKHTSSSIRVGMKLCEYFFPNFFNIRNSKNISFSNSWDKENLKKVLTWNRKSHSTPYMSELRRGIYFCCGLTKNTMYRPHMAKTVAKQFSKDVVLDPCCGWGGRMLGVVTAGKKYVGFEPNEETYNNLIRLAHFLGIENRIDIYNDGAENMHSYDFQSPDLILTSPPYFNLEIYSSSGRQSENMFNSYNDWRDNWLKKVINLSIDRLKVTGYSAWNVHNVGKMKMISDIESIHEQNGYQVISEYSLSSSKHQSNDTTHRKKNNDLTRIFHVSSKGV